MWFVAAYAGDMLESRKWQGLWEKKNSSQGRGAPDLVEIYFRIRFSPFFVFFFQNCPSPLSVLRRLIFIGKNIARFPNLVTQLLCFCKFVFFLTFCIF